MYEQRDDIQVCQTTNVQPSCTATHCQLTNHSLTAHLSNTHLVQRYGICIAGYTPFCSCIPLYHIIDPPHLPPTKIIFKLINKTKEVLSQLCTLHYD